jgi:uncharacterized cupin superfamily protein
MGKQIITESDVLAAAKAGAASLAAAPGQCLVTPQARERAAALGLALCETPAASPDPAASASAPPVDAALEALVAEVCTQLQGRIPAAVPPQELARLVREAASERLAKTSAGPQGDPVDCLPGVRCIRAGRAPRSSEPGGTAVVAEAAGGVDGLAAGYLAWEKGSFSRVVEEPEITIVLAGELQLSVDGKALVARPGDMLQLAKGAAVVFTAPGAVRLACVNRLP